MFSLMDYVDRIEMDKIEKLLRNMTWHRNEIKFIFKFHFVYLACLVLRFLTIKWN